MMKNVVIKIKIKLSVIGLTVVATMIALNAIVTLRTRSMKVILAISVTILIIASFYINWQAAGLMFVAWFIDNLRNLQ